LVVAEVLDLVVEVLVDLEQELDYQ